MAHSSLFARLRRLAAMSGHRRGLDTSKQLSTDWAAGLLSRRHFGATTAALTLGDLLRTPDRPRGGDRVVIVGAGIAGICCAYRLAQAGIKAVVHEARARIGGRTYSTSEGAPPGMVLELGGELIDSNHLNLWALAEELGLTLDDRRELAPAGEVFWIDGAAVDEATILAQWMAVAPAMAAMVEAANNDDDVFDFYDNQSLREWLDEHVPIDRYRELHLILDVAYRGEFGLENDQQSALNLLYLLDPHTLDELSLYGESDERYHTHGGNEQFVRRMAETLDDDQLVLESRLLAARDGAAGGYVLSFRGPEGEAEVEADHVVFALPFSVLREVELGGLSLSAQKRKIIAELGYGTNTKIIGSFHEPSWRAEHGASGSITGDLSFQQCWDSSIGQLGSAGIITSFLGGRAGLESGQGSAEDWYRTHLVAVLEQVFPGVQAGYVGGSAVRMHWPSVPTHRGSYTCYRPGQWAFWSREGVREGNLHFCGEHCSPEFQGWMEGAAETGGLVAMEIIDDLGARASDAHAALTALLTEHAPHPCYHGDLHPPLRWGTRRRGLGGRIARRLPA
ncbi:MAG: NAD(P)/FAD-dependent oxidoreductase [Enhygromyxa sp.]